MKRKVEHNDILKVGLEIMYTKGYYATGIKEIADAAGILKGSFYNYYSSKEEFGKALLEYYKDGMISKIKAELNDKSVSPLQRIKDHFHNMAAHIKEMGDYSCGCFAGNMSQEIGDTCPTLSLATKEVTEELKSVFKGCIQEAIVSGEIDADCDADTITEFIYNSWQGAILSMKSSKSSVPIDAFMEIVFKKLIH